MIQLPGFSNSVHTNASHLFFSPDDWFTILLRISLAVLAGGWVGLNLERIKRPGEPCSSPTVNVGSVLFWMPTPAGEGAFKATNALSRTAQGVVTGPGSIASGLIAQPSQPTTQNPSDRAHLGGGRGLLDPSALASGASPAGASGQAAE